MGTEGTIGFLEGREGQQTEKSLSAYSRCQEEIKIEHEGGDVRKQSEHAGP